MVRHSDNSDSNRIANELSKLAYGQYAEGADTQLAHATTVYMTALQDAAMELEIKHSGLDAADFVLAYHNCILCDL